jgi:transcriptional regulator with XRE-family HTH domain
MFDKEMVTLSSVSGIARVGAAMDSKLKMVRVNEGWSVNKIAAACGIANATYRKAEDGEPVQDHIWGKILKGINKMENKSRTFKMEDVKGTAKGGDL